MEQDRQPYPVGTTSVTLTVPSGVARTFTLLANTPSVTLKRNVTVDLAPDETKEIGLTPTLSDTQIIVPDYHTNRLVQISDMHGAGWRRRLPIPSTRTMLISTTRGKSML